MRALGIVLALSAGVAFGQDLDWSGEWVMTEGKLELQQSGTEVEGKWGAAVLEGKARGRKLSFVYSVGRAKGEGSLEMGKDRNSFSGSLRNLTTGWKGNWQGWRKDPKAEKGKAGKFGGVWLSSLGTMVLEQKGSKVKGTYGSEGWSEVVNGEVKGRRLYFTWKRIRWSGPAWIELTKDGKRFFGMTEENKPARWFGLRIKDWKPAVKPKPGKVVQGLSKNRMLYFLRAPKRYRAGRKTDAIVLLHGSNWTTKGMVWVTARNWPDLGDGFMIIGIQGQNWAEQSKPDDLRHNYTYVNWMGKSTYKGYPYTHKESPALVAEVIEELRERHKLDRVFLGGHSQGGYLAFLMYMHFPDLFAGVFPMSCGLVIQAEPDVFDDEELKAAQRNTPLAIIHGRKDSSVKFSSGEYNHDRFAASGFPRLAFFSPDLGHGYDFLPVGDAVRWMDALSSPNPEELLSFAKERAEQRGWRDVAAALIRAGELKASARFGELKDQLEVAARKDAAKHLARIQANKDGKWVDSFLRWRDEFEFAPGVAKVMAAFHKLRDAHDPPAKKLIGEARKAFRGDPDTGWAKYQEVVDRYYACRRYRVVRRWLKDKPK